ncbi:pyridoxamine 5'-phosphate oxidase [Lipingzhangella halophila]|uniref:Pyridoxine/pyridoxamine 5'-phosphate oxidase n=2 Tax=Lipingzhangella halophila TaxID=1783352 RepID=A0A7W7W5P5_9ACTN|nr:pyridoxamine 5'-phosphate oxidase [Lipingzhangella halophila]
MDQFHVWFTQARGEGLAEPNAMALATVEPRGVPRVRIVLLKGYDRAGFRFFTNYRSRKGRALLENPNVSVVFPWHPIRRQVSVSGRAERLSEEENDAYFRTRPHGSQVGAWASEYQSSPVRDRAELEERFGQYERTWTGAAEIPRPEYWGGYRILPSEVEFWQGRADRMHDRFRYRLRSEEGSGQLWDIERLSP